jgi:hypothetical protein
MTNRPENFRVEDTEEYTLLEWEFEQMTKSYDKIWDSFEEIQIIYSNKKTTIFRMPTKDCKKLAEALEGKGALFDGTGADK